MEKHGIRRGVRSSSGMHDSDGDMAKLFACAPVGMSEISLEGRFLRVNDALCRMLDRPQDAMLRLAMPDVIHPEDPSSRHGARAAPARNRRIGVD